MVHQLKLDLSDAKGTDRADTKAGDFANLSMPSSFVKLSPPKPTALFQTYWEFAAKRQCMYFARVTGSEIDYQFDPILARHRFTNIYRAADRVSQYLIRNVIYSKRWQPEDLFFRIMLFKFFNKIETWETLEAGLGEIKWQTGEYEDYDEILNGLIADGEKIYSGAYIMASGKSQIGNDRKHQNHLRVIDMMMQDRVAERIAQQRNLESAYRLLRRYPCIGPFVGYQFAIDLNYSSLLQFSENDFVEAGPGALDGITKCFSDLGDFRPNDIIHYMVDVQESAFSLFEIEFRNLWGRRLHLVDCQNAFCEVDKYARVAFPNMAGLSGRKRIKQSYSPSSRGLPRPYFPPKWDINKEVEKTLSSVQG